MDAPHTGAMGVVVVVVVMGVEAITVALVHTAMGVVHTRQEVMDMDQLLLGTGMVHRLGEVLLVMVQDMVLLVMVQDMVLVTVRPCMGMVLVTTRCMVLVHMVMLVLVLVAMAQVGMVLVVLVGPALVAAVIMVVLVGAGDKGDITRMGSNGFLGVLPI